MCGIFAYAGVSNQGQKYILNGLKSLEYRGYDSWGIALKTKNDVWLKKDIGKIGSVSLSSLPKSSFGIGHTRWATHGGVTKENSHPHTDCNNKIFLVHNGIIENYQEIKDTLSGHIYRSETDTEVLAHLIEEERKSKSFKEAVFSSFRKAKGLSAVIAFEAGSEEFVAIRNGSPLVLGFGGKQNYIASDPSALVSHTKNLYFLKDGQGAVVSKDGIECYTMKGDLFDPKIQKVGWVVDQANRGEFDHYMIKEIFDQKKVVKKILTSSNKYEVANSMIRKASNIIFLGCGTASYAAMIGTYLFSNVSKIKTSWVVGSELTYQKHLIDKDTLIIALSQSGETMDIIQSIKIAKKSGGKILSLVNVEGSTLFRMSDHVILLKAGIERAVASTKAFTAMIAHLLNISHSLSDSRVQKKKIVDSISSTLSKKSLKQLRKLAYLIKGHQHLFVVGRGASFPLSLEAALKIKEVSYIHAEGFAAGELKHGVIALIEKGTPCIVYAPNDQAHAENMAAAMELRARGGYIIGISPTPHEVFDFHIQTQNLSMGSIFQDAIIGQLLAYYLSVEKGIDPDMPKNLAKSVTVK